MLRSFRVANHKSIRDEQELLLMPAYDKSREVVPVTAVYGANAAGKSNVLDAISFMRRAVLESYRRWEPDEAIPRTPFKLNPNSIAATSHYVIDVVLDEPWTYGFEVDDARVIGEWLYSYPKRRKRVVFERDEKGIRFGSTVAEGRERTKVLQGLTRDNALFLSVCVQAGLSEVRPLYEWFSGQLRIRSGAAQRLIVGSRLSRMTANLLEANSDRHDELMTLIAAADLGIQDVVIEDSTESARIERTSLDRLTGSKPALVPGHDRIDRMARFVHGGSTESFDFTEESAGTLQWVALMPSVLSALSQGDVLVVDEIDSSLHPRLVARLIELFRSTETNSGGGQLIFTTHDASLLGTSFGRPVLERDEIWFAEKDTTGSTSLFALSDFHPRSEDNRERRYLGGSYGAVPALFSDSLVEQVLEARRGSSSAAS